MSRDRFMLLNAAPIEKDAAAASNDLLQVYGLGKISSVVLGGNNKVENYLQVDQFKEFRKGPGLDIAPLADVYPASNPPGFKPLSTSQLQAAFTLESSAGHRPITLTEQQLGTPVDTRPLLGGGQPRVTAQHAAQPAAPKPMKIKFRVK